MLTLCSLMRAGETPVRGVQPMGSAMGEIVNLHKVRKRAARERDARRAAENRITHGRTKAERTAETTRSEKIRRLLDAHKIEPGDPP
jgi:hypothetical protein